MEIFDYDNILLLPRKCRVESRSECDASVELGGRTFRLPVVPANMKTVLDEKICKFLAQHGYFYVMHRFDIDNVAFTKAMQSQGLYASISLGVKQADYEVVDRFVADDICPEYITIDIAHGHADSVKNMIQYLKAKIPAAFVIAGNVATPEAVIDLEAWGADATKVGVGPGKVCITKLKTGFGTGGWQLSALKWCARVATKPIIADGGIRSHGDIAQSIRFGATMVMIGSLFAGHEESPGKTVEVDGELFKEYDGSASVVPGVLTAVGRSWAHSAGCEGSMPVASRASVSMWRWENGEVRSRFFFLQRNIVIPKKGEMGRVRA